MKIVRYSDGMVRYGLLEEDGATIRPMVGDPFGRIDLKRESVKLEDVRLLAPVEPRAVYGVGLNYVRHAQEANLPLPTIPLIFMKPPAAITGPGCPIILPREAKETHYEGELAVVIGRAARRVSEDEALDYVLGYTCGNDVSERVIQKQEMAQGALTVGKGFDSFNPVGPVVATDINPRELTLATRVNGVERQRSNTDDLVFSVQRLIAWLSAAITLYPGDIIMTGTPFGVGPLHPGDEVEVEIDGIGILRNPVVGEL